MRVRRLLAAVVSVGAVIGCTGIGAPAALAGPAHPAGGTAYPEDWCGYNGTRTAPCIVSVTRNGNPILSSDTTWVASISDDIDVEGDQETIWSMSNEDATVPGGYASMGPAAASDLWSMTVKVDQNPRSIAGYADQMQTSVTDNGDGTWDVTTTGYPVTSGVNDECQPVTPVTCPSQAAEDVTSFQFQSDNFEFDAPQDTIPPSQYNDYNGLRQWTNVEESDLPPQISGDPLEISEQLGNSYQLSTGVVFQGFFDAILPNAFLVDMGIDDPSTIDPSSISTSIGSGTVSVVPGPTSTEIDITGITFPSTSSGMARVLHAIAATKKSRGQTLKIKRGTITPTRVKIIKGHREPHNVRLSFSRSKPRGSHLKHYEARCAASGQPTRTATGKHSPLTVRGLTAGVSYKCQVRAKAKVGYGSWSKKHTVRK